jgi:hypothetical protein
MPASGYGNPPRARWADEEVPWDQGLRNDADEDSDGYMDEDATHADRVEEDGWAEEGGDEGAEFTPEQLRQAWAAECRAVRALEAQGRHAGSAALAAAKEARDEAEAAWRRAIVPPPLAVRMGRVQQRLDKAAKAVERARLDLEEFEEQAEARREDLRRRIDEAEARYRARSDQMDELHCEAGELAAASAASGATRRTADDVCDMVASELQALAESLGDESDAKGKINLLLSKMVTAAGGGGSGSGPQSFNIAEADGDPVDDDMRGVSWEADARGRWNRRGTDVAATDDGWQRPRRPVRRTGIRADAGADGDTPGGAAPSGGAAAQADRHQGSVAGGASTHGEAPRGIAAPTAPPSGGQSCPPVANAAAAAGSGPHWGRCAAEACQEAYYRGR